jgi:SPP1 family predicted phage head-tail adaptor
MPLPRLSARPPGPGQYTAPGAFNRWITFYNAANPTAGIAASPFKDSWAAIRALTGQEIEKAQQIVQRASHLVTTPYQPGVLESMTIGMYEGSVLRMLQIADIEDPDERHVELRMLCFEINQNAGSAS